MEKARSKPKERHFRKAIIYFLTWCLVFNTSLPAVLALEAVDVFNSSGATPQQWGDHTIIDTDHGAIINWSNFNTSTGQSVTFNQFEGGILSTQSAVLNRISSGAIPTQFNGALIGNGRVFVVNPAGIVFGPGSTVNVAQLVASGLNMTDDAFNAAIADPTNDMVFQGGAGEVENSGTIQAEKIYIVGKKAVNRSVLRANDGLIVMAAGSNVFMAQDGSNVLIQLSGAVDQTADIVNRSVVTAPRGEIVLAAGDTLSRAISNAGVINASSGTITARAARIENIGTITAIGDGGTINLTGVEQVKLDSFNDTSVGTVSANAWSGRTGGTINIESQGMVTITDRAAVLATGGPGSGDGGSITITADHFSIAGQIDASPGNVDDAPGTLTINTPNITIADGANAGASNTIYEQDIETLSDKGTSLVINSQQGITVPDITDDEIKGRYGSIELHATNADSFINFADATDTISTTLGNIVMGAGSGGINIGNLETARDLSDFSPTPGQIVLATSNRGNITANNLTIRDGWGRAEINVNASGALRINGNVTVGSNAPIGNIPGGHEAEAMIFLKAGDNMFLDGDISASAHGFNPGLAGGVTRAYIGIFSGTNNTWFGDLTINGDLTAKAISSTAGSSDATIEIDSWGAIAWGPNAADPLADGDTGEVHVQSKDSATDTNGNDIAKIIVNVQNNAPQPDGIPDFATTHMGTEIGGNVIDNDAHPSGLQLFSQLVEGPKHATSFSLGLHGEYVYTPEPGFVGQDTFTYVATTGFDTSNPTVVTITITNTAPTAIPKTEFLPMSFPFEGTVSSAISDADGDPLTTALIIGPTYGTVTLNPNGTYNYQPDAGFVGNDSFTFSATDGEIGATPVEATINITLTNIQPSAVNDEAATNQGIPRIIYVLGNDLDPDGHPLTVTSVTYTGSGSVRINSNNTITYTSADDFIGMESFTYSATDGQIGGTPTTATVTVTVSPLLMVPPAYFMPTGPGLEKTEVDISGCLALTAWVAREIGVDTRKMQIWIVNGLASARGVQPCDACTNLRKAANILADPEGIYSDSIALIVDEFGSRTSPMTEELAAYITNAMATDNGTREHYARAETYFDALADYVGILHNDMGFSVEKSAQMVNRKYIDRLARDGKVGVASYAVARLESMMTFLTVVDLNRANAR